MARRIPVDYVEKLDRAVELVRGGLTQTEAARVVGVSQGRVSEYIRGIVTKEELQERASRFYSWDVRAFKEECRPLIEKAYRDILTDARIKVKFPCRVVFVDDLHIPFTDWETLDVILQREAGADYLVTFELVNFDGFSRFPQTYLSDPDSEEDIAIKLVSRLKESFGQIIEGTSNHMDRPGKYIYNQVRPEQMDYIKKRLKTVYEAVGEAGVLFVKAPMVQIGDAIFGHSDYASFAPGAAARKLKNFAMTTGRHVYGIKPPVSAVFSGHTHRICQTFDTTGGWDGYLFEAGSVTHIQPYAVRINKRGRWNEISPALGYAVAEFDSKGKIDLTESRVVHLGWAAPPGKRRG